jgi:hypothetical protein
LFPASVRDALTLMHMAPFLKHQRHLFPCSTTVFSPVLDCAPPLPVACNFTTAAASPVACLLIHRHRRPSQAQPAPTRSSIPARVVSLSYLRRGPHPPPRPQRRRCSPQPRRRAHPTAFDPGIPRGAQGSPFLARRPFLSNPSPNPLRPDLRRLHLSPPFVP